MGGAVLPRGERSQRDHRLTAALPTGAAVKKEVERCGQTGFDFCSENYEKEVKMWHTAL